ncbi:serine/arginine repetitive matrix protein 1-like [Daphnia carinata]|uniref:serine/arginine repetitive matrix protein 1-like n=1 Tax=Daphnia carinata TaxID=120202 RepID=UPI00257EDAC7|nr:serine/arginine repetitive matrix protein 1-like [Daphnia carinata]
MRIVALYLACLWSSLVCPTFEMEQPHRQKRQLDWNSGGRIYHFDHLAMSSDISPEHRASGEESSSSSEEDPNPVQSTALPKSGLPGDPGIDYPILPSIPLTDFHCRGRAPGFYGDTQTACQVFHVCDMSGRQDSFLCPNGTIFSQQLFACDWWYNVKCSATRQHYQLNSNLFKGGDVNLYGTPSFWNWLSESEEVQSNTPSPKDKGRSHQKAATRPNKYVETPSPAARGPSVQLQKFTEPTTQQLEIEQLPEPAPLVQSQPAEQLSEPVVDSAELQPIGPPKVETARPSQWESFVPLSRPAPQVAATLPPSLSDDHVASQGFTTDYQNHYFNWINEAIHPGPDMAPELSWSDLGPNGPLMTGHRSQVADEQSTGQQSPPVDRRRKAKPAVRHTQKPVAVKKQTLPRQAAALTPPTQPPAYVSKATSFKKQNTSPSKQVATLPPIKPSSKPVSKPGVSKASPSLKATPTSTPKSKPSKTKPKERSSTVTETFDRPTAKNDYFNEDEDVAHYDDTSNKSTNQRIREVIARQTSRFGSKLKKAGRTQQTESQETTYHAQREKKFVPSPKLMPIVPSPQIIPNRSDAVVTNPFTWVVSPSQPVSSHRTEPFWGHSPARNFAYYQPPTSSPVSRAQQPTPAANWLVGPSVFENAYTERRSSKTPEVYRPSEARSLDQSSPSLRKTLALERIQPAFRPSQPIPAITSNSHQPRVRTLRAHPSPKGRSAGVKRKRNSKSKAITAYDPRLDRPYGQNHPIWKLQNWESTKI